MSEVKAQERQVKYTVLARYGAMRSIGLFSTTIKKLRFGDKCILRSTRGTEWGEVTSEPKHVEDGSLDPRRETHPMRPGELGRPAQEPHRQVLALHDDRVALRVSHKAMDPNTRDSRR